MKFIHSIFSHKVTLLLLLTSISISCLEELKVDIDPDEPQLVVEGSISNIFEPYKVRLSTLFEANGLGTNTLGRNATVNIIDEDNNRYPLFEESPGLYTTIAGVFGGEIGKSYRLSILLENGEEYLSDAQEILPAINVVSSEVTLLETEFDNITQIITLSTHHRVDVEIENTSQPQFFIIENKAWTKVEVAYPDCPDEFTPGPIFSWQYTNKIGDDNVNIGTNQGLSSGNYKMRSKDIPIDNKHEYIDFTRIKSMSAENYIFWQAINDQLQRPGGLFDRPFAPIVGNINSVNTDRQALGYFNAYAISEFITCIDRSDVTFSATAPRIACSQFCTDHYPNSTFTDVSQFYCED